MSFRLRTCVLCRQPYQPYEARSKTCLRCRAPRCAECGRDIPGIHLRRRQVKPRLCMECHRAALLPIGSRRVETSGYVSLKTEAGWVSEHRHVAEQSAGRALLASEHVHHRNGDQADNRSENLEVLSGVWEHQGRHHRKMDWQKVAEIRRRAAAGESDAELALVFGLDKSGITRIRNGQAWVEPALNNGG